jgi:uncharacterized protein with HEPN domain
VRSDRERLLDIQEAIARIEKYAARGEQAFRGDELIQTWIVHYLGIIGEAVRGLSEEFRRARPQWPFQGIVGMRNILVQVYFGIDLDLVWKAVERDVPALRALVDSELSRS